MKIKDFSIEQDFSEELRDGLFELEAISIVNTGLQIVITSGSEDHAKHSAKSKHYKRNNASGKGEAADVRTFIYTPKQQQDILNEFKSDPALEKKYDLVLEKDHFHLEHDPK